MIRYTQKVNGVEEVYEIHFSISIDADEAISVLQKMEKAFAGMQDELYEKRPDLRSDEPKKREPKFKVGDRVQWLGDLTSAIYTIVRVHESVKTVELEDANGDLRIRTYAFDELVHYKTQENK